MQCASFISSTLCADRNVLNSWMYFLLVHDNLFKNLKGLYTMSKPIETIRIIIYVIGSSDRLQQ